MVERRKSIKNFVDKASADADAYEREILSEEFMEEMPMVDDDKQVKQGSKQKDHFVAEDEEKTFAELQNVSLPRELDDLEEDVEVEGSSGHEEAVDDLREVRKAEEYGLVFLLYGGGSNYY